MTNLQYLEWLLDMERGILREIARVLRLMVDGDISQAEIKWNNLKAVIAEAERLVKKG